MTKVLIAGTGGFADEVACWAKGIFDIVGYIVSRESAGNGFERPGLRFTDEEVTPEKAETDCVLLAIGSSEIRKRLHFIYKNKGFRFPNLIHSTSTLFGAINLGEGIIIAPHCVISTNVRIGDMSYLNFQCGIGHDSIIGNYVQINPGAQLGGSSLIGDESLIGSGSTILQGIEVGSKVTVASGSVVFSKIPDGTTVIGNPAKRIPALER